MISNLSTSRTYRNRLLFSHFLTWSGMFVFFLLLWMNGFIQKENLVFNPHITGVILLIFSAVFSLWSGYSFIFFAKKYFPKVPLKKILFYRIIFSSLFLGFLLLGSHQYYLHFFSSSYELYTTVIYTVVCIILIDFCLALSSHIHLMHGGNTIPKVINGKETIQPKEEIRIFMFMDLQASTQIAENIGHKKYSQFLKDCFNDISIVDKYAAEIYQYVGDQVVLTWLEKDGLWDNNFLKAYFEFSQLLHNKKEYYLSNYGYVPFFKAGVHIGKVTSNQVGKYKRELAYHGDTINTAARIQGKCGELNQAFLISHEMKSKLTESKDFHFELLGISKLKGKLKTVMLWSVSYTQ